MSKDFKYIGRSVPRVDAAGKVTGRTRFVTDEFLDRMVHAYPFYSAIPFGRVTAIDIAPAASQPGILGVLTARDIPGKNQVGVIIEDQPLLADPVVRFVGDTIGIVVAETAVAARRAARLVMVQYEEFEPIFSIAESKAATGNFIHDSNVACRHRVDKGDIEAGFASADQIIEADFVTPFQEHYYLEPQGCIVIPEDDGSVTVHGSIQCIYYVQKAVARVLGIPFSKVRVVQSPIGGGFGGKEDIPSELCARAALAAVKFNRPVKMVYNRRDDVQLTSKRHPFQIHFKVGVTNDGRLLAADIRLEENSGAYATLSTVVSSRSTIHAMGPYVIPNIRVRSTAWYTNLPTTGAFRGFGSPQATFGHERMLDIIADSLGIDPVELRLKNVLRTGDLTQTGQKLSVSVGAEETITRSRDRSDWNAVRSARTSAGRYLSGIGIAASHYGNCLGAAGWALDGAGAKIQIRRDGSVAVAYGLAEMGQGALTAVTQMTAEALGIDSGRITVPAPSTDLVPDSGPGVASRNVVMTGNAIRDAAAKLAPILKTAAAAMLETDPEKITIAGDRILVDETEKSDFGTLADYLFTGNYQMDMLGWWHVPALNYDPEKGIGEAYFTYSYATHVAKVRVDRLTGLVHVDKIWAAHDIGQAINPAGLEGQVEGGTTQGIGWALTEQFKFDRGRVLTGNLSTYLLPTAADVGEVETILVEAAEPLGPWGAKGIGEPAVIPTAAAIANAVSHAIGVQLNEIPLTPEKVLAAIEGRDR
ncbi:MAG: xanthine dehydrogenase family protein molybdopterin-binding subunit [Candidatus Neomarinimicrobiota bacterium]